MSKNKLIYIANAKFPNQSANNIHIWNMCHALHNIDILDHVITRANYPFESNGTYLKKCKKIFSGNPKFKHKRLRSLRGLKDFDFNFNLRTYLKKIKAELVYTRALNTAYLSIDTPSLRQLVLELHEPPRSDVEKAQFSYICEHQKLKKIVCITNALKTYITHHYNLSESLIEVLPDCASPIEFKEEDILQFSDKYKDMSFDVCYVGHLYEGSADILIPIAKELKGRTIHVFGGTNKDIARFSSSLNENNVRNIILHGHVKYIEARYIMKCAKVVLMPYSEKALTSMGTDKSKWMSPLKMYEYMLSKSLILTSDLKAIREVLDSDAAVFLNCNNPIEWAEAIDSCLLDLKKYASKVDRAYELAKNLTWEARAERISRYFYAD